MNGLRHRTGVSLMLLAVAVVVLVVQALVFAWQGRQMLREVALQERQGMALVHLRLVWQDLQDMETGQRGYLLTGDTAYLEPYERGTGRFDDHLRLVYESLEAAGRGLDQIAPLQQVARRKMSELDETVRLRRAGKTDAAIARLREGDGKRYMDEARQIIDNQMNAVRADRTGLSRVIGNRIHAAEIILVSIGVMVVLTVSVAAVQMVRAVRTTQNLAQQLEEESTHDGLTGLPNRRMLDHWLEKTLEQAARKRRRAAFLFIDLDGFKRINDELGHETGDRVLAAVALRFAGVVRNADLLARFGGDEFVVVVAEASSADHLAALADRLQKALVEAPLPEHPEYRIGASIGIAMYPEHGMVPGTLIRAADTAMYEAKRAGRGQCRFATDGAS
jgi:diguanylate cyclase (GGDEF)-like protein